MILRTAVLGSVLLTMMLVESVVGPAVAVLGVAPDLTVVAVVCLALADGRTAGARFGFVAGLARDLLVPLTGLMGPWTLGLLFVGYLAGVLRSLAIGSALPGRMIAGASGAALASIVAGLLTLILGAGPASAPDVARRTMLVALWAAVLTPLVCRLVQTVTGRASSGASSGNAAAPNARPSP